MDEWDRHVKAWKESQARALAERTCFCIHGCDKPATHMPLAFLEAPGMCDDCHKEAITKKGSKVHHRMIEPGDTWVDPEDREFMKTMSNGAETAFAAHVPNPRRREAEEYARDYGDEGLVFMRNLRERVRSGKSLTELQIESILRSKEAEERSSDAALQRAMSAARRVERKADDLDTLDLRGLPVGTTYFAVEADSRVNDLVFLRVDRPASGRWRNWAFVNLIAGETETRYGVQRPQPWFGKARNFYQGNAPSLVAKVLDDPETAMRRYGQTVGKCARCGMRLTNPTSRELGLGPECAALVLIA